MSAAEVMRQMDKVSGMLQKQEQITRAFASQDAAARAFARHDAQVADAFAAQDRAVRALSQPAQVAGALRQFDQLTRTITHQTQSIRRATEGLARALTGPDGPLSGLARVMDRQREAVAEIADSTAMKDLAQLRNQLAHFTVEQPEVVKKFAKQHEAVLRLLNERARSVDYETWRYFTRATGTAAAPRGLRRKAVVRLTEKETRYRPHLPGVLREQGWEVLVLAPFDRRRSLCPDTSLRVRMAPYVRGTDRGQARAPTARERRSRGCPDEPMTEMVAVQQRPRQVEGGGRVARGHHAGGAGGRLPRTGYLAAPQGDRLRGGGGRARAGGDRAPGRGRGLPARLGRVPRPAAR